jgi:hypothetical protein
MSTHIALIGRNDDPVLKGYQHYGGIRKLYLLHSPDDSEFKFRGLAMAVKKKLVLGKRGGSDWPNLSR